MHSVNSYKDNDAKEILSPVTDDKGSCGEKLLKLVKSKDVFIVMDFIFVGNN